MKLRSFTLKECACVLTGTMCSNPEFIVYVENMCSSIINNLLLCVKTVEASIDRSTEKKLFGWDEELSQLKRVNSGT